MRPISLSGNQFRERCVGLEGRQAAGEIDGCRPIRDGQDPEAASTRCMLRPHSQPDDIV